MIIKEQRKTSGSFPMLKGVGVLIIALIGFDHISESNIVKQSVDRLFTAFDPIRGDRIASASLGDDLSNGELARHAANSYGWDCDQVVLRGRITTNGYFPISCNNGRVLHVYPRYGAPPLITNRSGGNL